VYATYLDAEGVIHAGLSQHSAGLQIPACALVRYKLWLEETNGEGQGLSRDGAPPLAAAGEACGTDRGAAQAAMQAAAGPAAQAAEAAAEAALPASDAAAPQSQPAVRADVGPAE
jgi:hypothetical protein